MNKGFWLPLKGPPEIAFSGLCDRNVTSVHDDPKNNDSSTSELWFSMMCAGGYEDGKLAQLISKGDDDENSEACDEFN